jgi:hypothetical protein
LLGRRPIGYALSVIPRRASLLLTLLLAGSFARAASDNDASGDGPAVVSDRQGNMISVSNGFDGNAAYVRMMSINRNRSVVWDRTHGDGYLERVSYAFLDATGSLVMAGVRLVQGNNYIWVMKYSESGNLLWEQVDSMSGCAAFNIAGNDSGDLWVAGSCLVGRNFSVRLLHYGQNGYLSWARDYGENGRNYVRNLSVDFMDRAAITMEIVSGGQRSARTAVFDSYGGRLTTY